jgi:hypothetical protein
LKKMKSNAAFWLLGALLAGGCLQRRAAPAADAPQPSEPGPQVVLTNTTFVINTCPDSKKMDSAAANTAMRKMVEPCAKAPGNAVRFRATLMPGGRIELASETGDRAEGVVPLCVLKNRLTHSVALKQPCTFDVKLEERSFSTPPVSSAQP